MGFRNLPPSAPGPPAILIALLLGGPAPAQTVSSAPGAILTEVANLPWGVSCARWSADRGTTCERFHGDGSVRSLEALWCRRSTDPATGVVVHFHVLDPAADPPACGLTELQWRTELSPGPDDLEPDLERRLTAAYGPPEHPERVDGSGTYWWRDLRRFQAPWGEVLLYRVVDRTEQAVRVHIRARSRGHAIRVAESPGYVWFRDLLALPDADSLLVAEVDPSWPGVRLLGTPVDTTAPPQAELAAIAAIAARMGADDPAAAGLLLLEDRLMERVAHWATAHTDDTLSTGPVVRELEAMGLELVWNPLGYLFQNPADRLLRLWETFPDTRYGQLAFAELQASGWDTRGMCSTGADQFREVIRRGRDFLAAYPSAPLADMIVLTLALAHETAWSLAQAAEDDTYVDPRDYSEGAEDARQAAIERYEQVLAGDPSPRLRTYATERLALLRLGLDTNQRAFHCVYD